MKLPLLTLLSSQSLTESTSIVARFDTLTNSSLVHNTALYRTQVLPIKVEIAGIGLIEDLTCTSLFYTEIYKVKILIWTTMWMIVRMNLVSL